MEYNHIAAEIRNNIGIITLNRPKALNTINEEMLSEIATQAELFDKDPSVNALIIRGNDKAFAAGIDIKELVGKINQGTFNLSDLTSKMNIIANIKKPVIAVVAGYALGIGCELALCCDFILAADNARFGLPEVSLGIIPSFGATQRLTYAGGKAKTMEMILTGRAMTAEEAEKAGIVSRIIALPDLFEESIRTASRITAQSAVAVASAKSAVKRAAANIDLASGIDYENKNAELCLNSNEFKELLKNFVEKHD